MPGPSRAPLIGVTVAYALGIVLRLTASLSPPALGAAAVCAGAGALARGRRGPRACALGLLWCCIGGLRTSLWVTQPAMTLQAIVPDDARPVGLHGVVLDRLSDPSHLGSDTLVLALRHRRTGGGWQPLRGRARVSVQAPRTAVRTGQRLVLEGRWTRVPARGNPGLYDLRAALGREGIQALVTVRPFDGIAVLPEPGHWGWPAHLLALRRRWAARIDEAFDARHAALMHSLVLGRRVALEESLRDAFVQTGTMHLLVISGSHVAVMALALSWLLRLLGCGWRSRLALTAAALGAYAVLVGENPPVVRATVMAWMVLGAIAVDRTVRWGNLLAAAALVMLWINPAQLGDPSFQLSFGAVLSLLVFANRWRSLVAFLGWVRPVWLRRYVALNVGCTTAVWVGLWPILAWYFFLVSPVSLVANLLVVPIVSALVVIGTAAVALGSVVPIALHALAPLIVLGLDALAACVRGCQRIPGSFFYLGQPPWWVVGGYYGLLGLSVLGPRLGLRRTQLVAAWLIGCNLWVWALAIEAAAATQRLRLHLLDVGHGDSLLLQGPGGQTLLVDAGTEEAGRRVVLPTLHRLGIRRLDALILTHLDADHIGGALPLLEALPIKRLLTNGARDDTMTCRRLERMVAQRRIPHETVRAGMRWRDARGCELEIEHPPEGLVPGTPAAANDNSVVLAVRLGRVRILLTGDLDEAGVPALLQAGRPLRATVLKVPHHGSALGAWTETFLNATHPALALISVGRRPGLPADETLRALARMGVRILMTRDAGAIRLETDGRCVVAVATRCESDGWGARRCRQRFCEE